MAMVCMVLFTGTSFASVIASEAPSATFWIKLLITFHRPKLDCETGFGLCFDVEWGLDKTAGSPIAMCPARASVGDNGELLLEVTEQDLLRYENGSTLPYFKGQRTITLEDPYTFSPEASKKLGSAGPITVPAGVYPVSCSDNIYTVVFKRQ